MTTRQYAGRLVSAGRVRSLGGGPGRYVVTAAAVRSAVAAGAFRGLACFVDHQPGQRSVRDLVGVWRDVRWDAATGSAVGTLQMFTTTLTAPVAALLDQWLAAAADGRPDVGVSLVFYPELAADGMTITTLGRVESADLVMFPASVGSRIVGSRDVSLNVSLTAANNSHSHSQQTEHSRR